MLWLCSGKFQEAGKISRTGNSGMAVGQSHAWAAGEEEAGKDGNKWVDRFFLGG